MGGRWKHVDESALYLGEIGKELVTFVLKNHEKKLKNYNTYKNYYTAWAARIKTQNVASNAPSFIHMRESALHRAASWRNIARGVCLALRTLAE